MDMRSRLALFTGEIRLYASSTTDLPVNWLRCNGSRVSRVTYSGLFAVIGTTYNVDNIDTTTFQLPDLRGRVVIGRDPSKIRTDNVVNMGDTGGQSKRTLTIDELPAHYHHRGSLTISEDGRHRHSIDDPGHTHSGQILEDHGNGDVTEYHDDIKEDEQKTDWYSDRIKIDSSTTGIRILSDGEHTHALTGNTGSTGYGHSFSLLNPYQTLEYIIYAG